MLGKYENKCHLGGKGPSRGLEDVCARIKEDKGAQNCYRTDVLEKSSAKVHRQF